MYLEQCAFTLAKISLWHSSYNWDLFLVEFEIVHCHSTGFDWFLRGQTGKLNKDVLEITTSVSFRF